MLKIPSPNQQTAIRDSLRLDHMTGKLHWLVSPRYGISPGDEAGCVYKRIKPYIHARVNGRSYSGHHLAWFLFHGEWPSRPIDHRNGVKNDNRPENLRLADRTQNGANRPKQRNNSTGFKGVVKRENGAFRAQIKVRGKQESIGQFSTPEEAAHAYNKRAIEAFGSFAQLNRVDG